MKEFLGSVRKLQEATVDASPEILDAVADLSEKAASLKSECDLAAQMLAELLVQKKAMRNQNYGVKSEKSKQASSEKSEKQETKPEGEKEERAWAPRGANRLPKDVPTRKVLHELPEDERVCPRCGGKMEPWFRETVATRVGMISIQFEKVEYQAQVCGCACCGEPGEDPAMKKAKVPPAVIPGGFAEPSLLAQVIWSKTGLGLPANRIARDWAAAGYPVPKQTLVNWFIKGAKLLKPIYEACRDVVVSADHNHVDETTLQVLNEEGKPARSTSYLWGYMTGAYEQTQAIFFEYQPNRSHDNPKRVLADYQGTSHADGYEAYHHLRPEIRVAGCWAHVRRKFVKAIRMLDKKDQENPRFPEVQGRMFIDRLYQIDHETANLPMEERGVERRRRSAPVLSEFREWLWENRDRTGLLGEAIRYARNQWKFLISFLDDGRIELDNNLERCNRQIAIGRNSWLFADSVRAAEALATLYSIVITATLNGLKPRQYLTWVLERIGDTPAEDMWKLMPWNAPEELRLPVDPFADPAA